MQGLAQVLAELPARLTADLSPPDLPPQNSLIDLAGSGGVRFPVIDDAVTLLEGSPLAVGADYLSTAAAIRAGAFAITGDLAESAVGEIREALADTLARGLDLGEFVDDVTDRIGSTLSPARLDTIFRAATGSAISDGMESALEHPAVVDEFAYRRYFATRDHRVRPEHFALETAGLDGTAIYRADDPVWRELRPPWDYGCRCHWSPISITMAARLGVQEAVAWLARAEEIAERMGGDWFGYVEAAAPPMPQFVPWPKYEGKEIHAPPGWSAA